MKKTHTTVSYRSSKAFEAKSDNVMLRLSIKESDFVADRTGLYSLVNWNCKRQEINVVFLLSGNFIAYAVKTQDDLYNLSRQVQSELDKYLNVQASESLLIWTFCEIQRGLILGDRFTHSV